MLVGCTLQVGGFFFMHRDDMQRVAPLWLSTTEEVREDPEVRSCPKLITIFRRHGAWCKACGP